MTGPSTLRNALEQMVQSFELEQGGSIEHALFTTFNFDPGFFERNVLPLVCGMSVADLQTMSVDAATRDMYHPLKKTNVVVAYDQGVMQGVSGGGVRYAILPRQLKSGFFHAKLVVLAGKDAKGKPLVTVMVGSGNMTLSGWADNIEVAAWVRVSQKDAQELLGFYRWLNAPAELQTGVDILAAITAPQAGHTLFLQYPKHPEGALFNRLFANASYADMQIYSPYWSEEAVRRFSPSGKVVCYPALNGEKGYLFPVAPEQLKTKEAVIELRAIKGEERFRHAKAYVWGNQVAIGSANCTVQALHTQNNVEAMLQFDGQVFPLPAFEPLSVWSSAAEDEEGIKPCPLQVLVVANYDKRHYHISLTVSNKEHCGEWFLRIGDMSFKQQGDMEKIVHFESGKPVARLFRLEWKGCDGDGFMTGMIIPQGGNDVELGYRPKRSLDRILEDMLRHRPAGGGGGGGGGIQGEADPESDEPELQQDETAFDFDMYGMYQSFFHLRKDVNELLASKGKEAKRNEISDTLLEILIAVKEGEVSNVLQRWLIVQECMELGRLLDDNQLLNKFSDMNKALNKEVREILLKDRELQRYKISADDLLLWVRKELGYAD